MSARRAVPWQAVPLRAQSQDQELDGPDGGWG